MVAAFGLFKQCKVFVKELFLGEGHSVNAGHHGAFLVAAPVCRTYAHYLKGLDGGGGHEVRTAAEVGVCTLGVGGNVAVFKFGNEFVLVGLSVVTEEFQCIVLADAFADECLLLLLEFLNLLFNFLKVFFTDCDTLGGHYIIVESVFYGGTDSELGAGPEFLHGFSHEVCRGVPKGVLAFGILPFVEVDAGILTNGAIQFLGLAVDAACQHVLCKTAGDAFGNLQAGDAAFVLADAAVRECNLYHLSWCFISVLHVSGANLWCRLRLKRGKFTKYYVCGKIFLPKAVLYPRCMRVIYFELFIF